MMSLNTNKQVKRCVNITRSKNKTPTNITKPQNIQAANTNNKRMKCVDISRSKTRAATNFRISVKNSLKEENKQPEKVCDYMIPRSKRKRAQT